MAANQKGAMNSQESWEDVCKKLEVGLTRSWTNSKSRTALQRDEAKTARIRARFLKPNEAERGPGGKKNDNWLSISDAVAFVQRELEVSLFDARETIIKGCATGNVWCRFVLPKQSEVLFCFIDPRWWSTDLEGLKIPSFEDSFELEVTATEAANFFIDVDNLRSWLIANGWIAMKGQIEWYPMIGRYGSKRPKKSAAPSDNRFAERSSLYGGSRRPLPPAPNSMIDTAISDAYSEAERAGQKPPNLKEIVAPVQTKLLAQGHEASGRQIQKLAEAAKHKTRRRKVGPTIASESHAKRW
jgi:hypothetical protein